MRITATIPDHGALVTAVMEGFVQAAMLEIEAGLVPPSPLMVPSLKFVDEPAGQEEWLLPHQVVKAGGGDCEDYAFWEAAGMRVEGVDPGASVVLIQTGPHKLHAVVQTSDGEIHDIASMIRRRHPLRQAQVSDAIGDNIRVIDHRSDAIRRQAAKENPSSLDAWMYQQGTRTFDSRYDVPVKKGVQYEQNRDDFLKAHGVKSTTLDDLISSGVVSPDKMLAYQELHGTYGGPDYQKFGRAQQRLVWNDDAGTWSDSKTGKEVDPSQVPGNNLDLLTLMQEGFDPSMLSAEGMFGGIPPDYAWGYPQYSPFGGFGSFGGFGIAPPGMADLDEVVDPSVFWSRAGDDLGLAASDVANAIDVESSDA